MPVRAAAVALLGCLAASAAQAQVTKGSVPVPKTALTNTVVAVDSGPGVLARVYCYNPAAAASYVQIFNAATSAVTLGTTTPTDVIGMAATSWAGWSRSPGDFYSKAISVAATTTATGSTAPGTALVCSFAYN